MSLNYKITLLNAIKSCNNSNDFLRRLHNLGPFNIICHLERKQKKLIRRKKL